MDADFLKGVVGDALSEGLSRVAMAKPSDSIDYLGNFLLQFAASASKKAAAEDAAVKADMEREAAAAAAATTVADEDSAAAATEEAAVREAVGSTTDVDAVLPRLMDLVKKRTGATSVYLGRRQAGAASDPGDLAEGEEEEVQDFISYVACSAGDEYMLDSVLLASEGTTFKAWEEAADDERDENGDPVEPAGPKPVHIANVLREPSAKFFKGYPRLGAYLAVGFEFPSCNSPEALDGAEAALASPPADGKLFNRTPQQMVLCIDTCGKNVPGGFGDDAVALVASLAAELAGAYERTEVAGMKEQVAMKKGGAGTAAAETGAAAASAEASAKAAEDAVAALGEEASEEAKALASAAAKLGAAKAFAASMKSKIAELSKFRVAPKALPCRALKAALVMLGYPKKAYANHNAVCWTKMRALFDDAFFAKLEAYDAEAAKKEPAHGKAEALRALLADLTADSINDGSVAIGAVFSWASCALDVREAAVEKRKADKIAAEEAAAAAAEEAAAKAEADEAAAAAAAEEEEAAE